MEREDYDWDDGATTYLEDHAWTLSRDGSAEPPQRGGFRA